ncbi:MAG: HlyD family efflux transporter periplasmic adaptor subunit [Gemmatimonadaceae bacterium]|nr:HlyD family efflux transporter periplasmic adaptor subunit [Gemmatimonadaceae bacterium]
MIRIPHLLPAVAVLAACRGETPDAYGRFEATEVTVAAEASGRLLSLSVDEGARVTAGAVVGLIDTAGLAFQRAEVAARRDAARSRAREVEATLASLATQRSSADRERARVARLVDANAATAQQDDRARRDADVLRDQETGARASRETVEQEARALAAQLAVLDDRLRRSRVTSPVAGTVLTRFVEGGEYVQPGSPLFKVAGLDTLVFRAYVSEAQLGRVALGQTVTVRVDGGRDSLRALTGRVTWIAGAAEYTPTPIQTRDERVTQVYAVKIQVANPDGRLRIGMPGDVVLAP